LSNELPNKLIPEATNREASLPIEAVPVYIATAVTQAADVSNYQIVK
jgi:hypothetical protein